MSDNETILIHGPPEDVNPVEQQLATITADMIRNMCKETIRVPQQHHRHIVGKQVANLLE